jgi:hypothetical protein
VSGDDVVVAHVSTLRDVKRPLDVVAAGALALRRNPHLVYLIVGDGPGRPAMMSFWVIPRRARLRITTRSA